MQTQTLQGEFNSQESDVSPKEPSQRKRSKETGQSLWKTTSVRRRKHLKKRQSKGQSEGQEET